MRRTPPAPTLLLAALLVPPAGAQCEPQKLVASAGGPGEWLGHDVALSGRHLLAGAPGEPGATGAALLFQRRGASWVEVARLVPPDALPGERWGEVVALRGDVAAVGSAVTEGVWVFERGPGGWEPVTRLRPSTEAGSAFGGELALGEGVIFAGAPGADPRGTDSGALHVFARGTSGWSEVEVLWPADGSANDRFGSAVSCSDGLVLAGAWGDGDEYYHSGSAYVFRVEGGRWRQSAKLVAGDGPTSYYFGDAVAISGSTAVVGAWGDDDQGVVSGSAYVFERRPEGWVQTAKLLASDGQPLDFFGWSVGIAGDTVLVGAYRDDDLGESSGAVVRFVRRAGRWWEGGKLLDPGGDPYDYFGYSLALDGGTAAIGAHLDDDVGLEGGAVHVFDLGDCPELHVDPAAPAPAAGALRPRSR